MDPVGIVLGRLYHLQPVLEEWVKLNQQCVDNWEGDIPWRYDEMAALSWFAGAIWRKGGLAMAEYSRHKSDAKRAFGRGDLWFEFQDKEYDIEAKLCRVLLNVHRYNPERLIMRTMSKAEKDIKASRPYSDERIRCAVLFSILSIDLTKAGYIDVIGPEF